MTPSETRKNLMKLKCYEELSETDDSLLVYWLDLAIQRMNVAALANAGISHEEAVALADKLEQMRLTTTIKR